MSRITEQTIQKLNKIRRVTDSKKNSHSSKLGGWIYWDKDVQ